MEKKAILVVSFGTTDLENGIRAIRAVEKMAAQAYPDYPVVRAFTSAGVIRKLAGKGINVDTPETALERLLRDDFRMVAVLPTFLAPGASQRELEERLKPWGEACFCLRVAQPLLSEKEQIRELAGILVNSYPVRSGEAVLFMGHGASGEDNRCYRQLEEEIQSREGYPGYVALLHGASGPEKSIGAIRAAGYKRVRLVPLMVSAGIHVIKNMAGETPESWKNLCIASGLNPECERTGLGELPEVCRMYHKQLEKLIRAKTRPGNIVQDSQKNRKQEK